MRSTLKKIRPKLAKISILHFIYYLPHSTVPWLKRFNYVLKSHPQKIIGALIEYIKYDLNCKHLKKQWMKYKEGPIFNFGGAKLPFMVIPDSFFNVLIPHAEGVIYNHPQIEKFYSSLEEKYSRLIYWKNNIGLGAKEPGLDRSHLISHGFTYFLDEVDIKQGDIVLDIGAGPGDFSIICAIRGAQNVFAFEPESENAKPIEEIKRINNANISIIPLFCDDNTFDKKITIDDFVKREGLTRIDFIKMDIEGAEPSALKGAQTTLERFSPKLSICTYHNVGDDKKIKDLIIKYNKNYRIIEKPGIIYAHV